MDVLPGLVPISCRFIPYDQWLVTHVDPSCRVKDIKLAILSKCITHPQNPTETNASRRQNQKRRRASPITFAQDPKYRPMSPITFAPTAVARSGESSDSSGQDIGKGYEEDNEEDSDDPDIDFSRGRSHLSSRILPQTDTSPSASVTLVDSQGPSVAAIAGAQTERMHASGTYDSDKLAIVRFTTGQLLEDDQQFDTYCIRPYELFEIHRSGVILRLPRNDLSQYVQPYWEGYAKALREVVSPSGRPRPNNVDGGKKRKPTLRTNSLEWRPRWVMIHRDELTLRKDRDDPEATQIFALSSLCEIQDENFLSRHVSLMRPASSQRIVCAKFRGQAKTRDSEGSRGARSVSHSIGPRAESASISRSKGRPRDYTWIDQDNGWVEDVISIGSTTFTTTTASSVSAGQTTSASSSQRPNLKLKVKGTPPLPSFSLRKGGDGLEEGRKLSKKGKKSKKAKRASLSKVMSPQLYEDEDHEYDVQSINSSADDEKNGNVSLSDVREEQSQSRGTSQASSSRHSPAHGPDAAGMFSPGSGDDSSVSSPRFAHGSDSDELDDVYGSRPRHGYNYYGYGFGSRGPQKGSKDRQKDDGEEGKPSMDGSFVHVAGDVPEEQNRKPRKRKLQSRKPKADFGEWVILELQDDNAYTSILRILHQHCAEPLSSPFVSALPSFGSPSSTAPSVVTQDLFDMDAASIATQTTEPLESEAGTDQASMRSSITQKQSTSNDADFELNRMPPVLTQTQSSASLMETRSSRSSQQTHPNFGAIPYPEWRTLITERAQRAGLGESSRAIEQWLLEAPADYEHQSHTSLFIVDRDPLGPKMGSRRSVKRRARKRPSARPSPQPSPNQESPFAHAPWNDKIPPPFLSSPLTPDSDSDSGDNSSEVEWLGWMGDLRRQSLVRKENEGERKEKEIQDTLAPGTPTESPGRNSNDFSRAKPDDHKLFASQRYALEPSATVVTWTPESPPEPTSPSPLPFPSVDAHWRPPPGHHTVMSMSSPSSAIEPPSPIRVRAVSFGVAPSEQVSLAASATQLVNEPPTPLEPFNQANGPATSSNISSWEDLVSRSLQNQGQRLAEHSSSAAFRAIRVSTSSTSVIQEHSPAPSPAHSVSHTHLTPNVERPLPTDKVGGSLARSASVFSKGPSLLRKKSGEPSGSSQNKAKRPKSSKGKEKERSEPPPNERSRRPRLSLSTGSQGSLRHQQSLSNVSSSIGSVPASSHTRSPSPSRLRVLSSDEGASSSPVNDGAKKKRGNLIAGMSLRAEKMAQRFDAALDFVDGK